MRYVLQLIKENHGTVRGLARALLAEGEQAIGRLDKFSGLPSKEIERLVFVCLGNINRSAFAHAVAVRRGARAISIGLSTTTGAPAFHKAIKLAPEFGVSLDAHSATDISDYVYTEGDLLLVMEVRHANALVSRGIPARAISLLGQWSTPRRLHLHDPHVLGDTYFRTCFTLINSAVANLVSESTRLGSPCVRT
jgi:protein-tyrosine phosphatase